MLQSFKIKKQSAESKNNAIFYKKTYPSSTDVHGYVWRREMYMEAKNGAEVNLGGKQIPNAEKYKKP